MKQEIGLSRNNALIALSLLYGVAILTAVYIYGRSGLGTLALAIVLALFFGAAENGRKKWLYTEEEEE